MSPPAPPAPRLMPLLISCLCVPFPSGGEHSSLCSRRTDVPDSNESEMYFVELCRTFFPLVPEMAHEFADVVVYG
ncbi:hypothetical protein EVAR_9324_1 [Eumeta japonica]|uniref:Secreted protein n=1 Tax=Eumeta variegata TaxID=151549 RepID=A0A4C1TLU5_EUMVA|nr:hypothetical protein EVAR_9324_1 [Eumeta japonica]